jgi:hypothetical protein
MSVRMEVAVRRGDVSAVIALIAKFSHETFAKLPMQYRSWWSVEDLMAYGTGCTVTEAVKTYKKNNKQGAQFITYLYVVLDNLYKDLLTEAYADKRKAAVFSADTHMAKVNGIERSMFDVIAKLLKTTRYTVEDEAIVRIDAEKAFLKVYSAASLHLRRHLINWCIAPKVTKYKLTGSQFKRALKEFKLEHLDRVLTVEMVRAIQSDALCRNRVVLAIIGSVKFSKPGFHTLIREGKPYLEQQMLSDTVYEYSI